MPIRFRCQYCRQLLGIARRKAGQPVECPTCHAQVTVPASDHPGSPSPGSQPEEPLFERSDFDKILQPPGSDQPPRSSRRSGVPVLPVAAQPENGTAYDNEPVDVERIPSSPSAWQAQPAGQPAPAPPRFLLSTTQITLLSVVGLLVLGLAFAAGLFVGRYLLAQP
jgi:hypothetical protein